MVVGPQPLKMPSCCDQAIYVRYVDMDHMVVGPSLLKCDNCYNVKLEDMDHMVVKTVLRRSSFCRIV